MGAFLTSRNLPAGLAVCAAGAVALLGTRGLEFGALTLPGPGFFPCVLGVVLLVLGVAVAAAAPGGAEVRSQPDWRGWTAIIAGMGVFAALGDRVGLAPASFLTVFVAALGDQQTSVRSAALLATVLTAFAVLLFGFVIELPMPILRGL